MKEELKNIRPILKKKESRVTDPVRFPLVINGYEDQSKRDFAKSMSIEQEHLFKQMNNLIN